MKSDKTRILLVDSIPAAREALAIRLSQLPDTEVSGEAGTFKDALRLVDRTRPDAVVTDIALDGGDGLQLIKEILSRHRTARVLVWSMYAESLFVERVLRAGALGYVTKRETTTQVIKALRDVLAGKIHISDEFREKLLRRGLGTETQALDNSVLNVLTDRELTVFRLIGQGMTSTSIARNLHLSVHTVETYRERIKSKLILKNAAELVRAAIRWHFENS